MVRLGGNSTGFSRLIIRRNLKHLFQRHAVKTGHALRQGYAWKLLSSFNARQISGMRPKGLCGINQPQSLGLTSVTKTVHDDKYIAPSANCKSSITCVWRETDQRARVETIGMERKHSIGWAIDQVCKTKKIPRVRLAEVTGRDPGTITKWLNYNKPI